MGARGVNLKIKFMFKVGQKVVYIGKNPPNPNIKPPQYNEVVTISSESIIRKGNYSLSEYPLAKSGLPQFFPKRVLRPLDYNFVEEVIKQVEPKEELV